MAGRGRGMFNRSFLNQPGSSTDDVAARYGLSADMFTNMFTLNPSATTLNLGATLTGGMGLRNPNVKKEEVKKKETGSNYVEEITEQEREKAMKILENGAPEERDLKDSSDARSRYTTRTNLDAVSTIVPVSESNADINISDYFSKKVTLDGPSSKLPICTHRNKICQIIRMNRVTIVVGKTGSGKTTQVPQFIMEDMAMPTQLEGEAKIDPKQFNIIVTQPRRIAAISVAKRVCDERGLELGDLVGYHIGMDQCKGSNTRLLFCTTGVLLEMLIGEKRLDRFTHIVVDEVHERDVDTDLLLMLLRKIIWMRPSTVKVVLMSATIEAERLQDYFALHHPCGDAYPSIYPQVITVDQRPKELKEFHLNSMPNLSNPPGCNDFDHREACLLPELYDIVCEILKRLDDTDFKKKVAERGAVLIFVPGLHEIYELMKRIKLESNSIKYWLLPLHSSINIEDQRKVFQPPNKGNRKVILATNIAESSITVPDVEVVIDFCLTKQLVVDIQTNYPSLQLRWISKSNAKQRAGRAGRTRDGKVFRLVYEEFYEAFPEYAEPELRRTPLELAVLRVKKADMGSPKEMLALCLDPPELEGIRNAVLRLKRVGALSITVNGIFVDEDGEVTNIGMIMAALPIDVQLSKLILMGYAYGCIEDCLITAACLSIKSMFDKPLTRNLNPYKSRLAWADRSFSDPLAYLNAYKMFEKYSSFVDGNREKLETWCRSSFIQLKRIKEVGDLIADLKRRLSRINIEAVDSPNRPSDPIHDEIIFKMVLAGAFFPHYFVRSRMDADALTRQFANIDPYSSVEITKLPQNKGVIYAPKICEIFKECSDQIDIEFEETKAIITFSGERNPLEKIESIQNHVSTHSEHEARNMLEKVRDTAIKTSVYIAVKMRHFPHLLEIDAFDSSDAMRVLDSINMKRDQNLAGSKKLKTNRYSVPHVPNLMVSQYVPSHMSVKQFPIFITHVVDCGHFWGVYRDERTPSQLSEIEEALQELSRKPVSLPVIGMLVRTENNGDLVRGIVQDRVVNNGHYKAKVLHIDYGSSSWVDSEDLDLIDKTDLDRIEILRLPGHGFECKLSGIKPAIFNSNRGNWTSAARDYFITRVQNKQNMLAEVYSVIGKVARVQLKDLDIENSQTINDALIEEGFAESLQETEASVAQFELRRAYPDTRAQYYTTGEGSCYEVLVNEQPRSSRQKICFQGPRSPLEVHFSGMTTSTSGLRVVVEGDSVNSVLLESDPGAQYTRLLVAAGLTISAHAERKVTARDTTMMPYIRGLPAFICLLFTPYCELFADKDRSIYVGALCGLGADRTCGTPVAYDLESDIPLEFDVAFSNMDIGRINVVRYNINSLFYDNRHAFEYRGTPLYEKQEKIRNLTLDLLKIERIPLLTSERALSLKWLKEKPTTPARVDNEEENPDFMFLPPMARISGINVEKWRNDVIENIQVLEELEKLDLASITTCLACNFKSYTLYDLRLHIGSDKHIQRVKEFKPEADWKSY
ncbi:ATP-dependent RNA helicase TDRD9 [Halotydeus destructor]|nr:ATP-dependent RNA helicase TDRD9 [Halotydeus destructor]